MLLNQRKCVLLVVFAIFLMKNFSTKEIYETSENVSKRLHWNQSKQQEVTGGRVVFDHDKSKGLYCKTTEKSFPYEFLFNIKGDYLVTSCKKFFNF